MTWQLGDPCPHCGSDDIRFNGGNPLCLGCGELCDAEHPRLIFEAVKNPDGSFTILDKPGDHDT